MRLLIPLCLLALVSACMNDAASISPPPLQHGSIVVGDGAVLPLRSWRPAGAPRAVVLALHGFNDYGNAFAGTGAVFAAQGVAVFAFDQRGFGAAPQPGSWAGGAQMADDALTALRLLRQRYPGVPVYLLGESMGAAVAVLASNRIADGAGAPDGVILQAPAVWGRATMNVFERAGLWLADLLPHVHWSPSLLPAHIVPSDNVAMLNALGADPLVIKQTRSDTLNGLVDLMGDALDAAPRFRARALILYGERDQIVPRHAVARFVDALPPDAAERQRLAVYPAGYHLLSRDLEGALVITDILAWIGAHDAPLPSGADRDAHARLGSEPSAAAPGNAASAAPAWQRAPS